MERVKKVKMTLSVLAGTKVWDQGLIIDSPIDPILLNEIRQNTGTVEVLEYDREKIKEEVEEVITTPKKIIRRK